jgi:hypothetical protein
MTKCRISLDVSPTIRREFEKLQQKSGKPTLVQTIISAMALYEMVVDHVNGGGKLVLKHKDGTNEVIKLV